jgi:hypothetical protein
MTISAPIHQNLAAIFHGQEKAGIGARGAQGRSDFAFGEVYGSPVNQIGGHDAQRNFHLVEEFGRREFVQEMLERCVRCHAHARKLPAAEIAKGGGCALALHLGEGGAAGVGGGDQRAHAGSGDEINRDLVLFEHAQDADMRNAARKSAAESQAYLGTVT